MAIITKYLSATNFRGARIKATTGNGKFSVTISYPYEDSRNAHALAALALARKLGWQGTLIEGGTATGSVFVFVPASGVVIEQHTI